MDRFRLKHFAESTRAFLLSKVSREALVFAFFLLLSVGFWLLQALNETNELELDFDLQLDNVPEGAVITTPPPSPIQVTVEDKGTSLLRYYFRRDRRLTLDFAQYDRGSTFGHVGLSHSEIQKLLQPRLDATSRITAIRPDTLEYYYTRGVSKRVPIEFVGHVSTDALSYLVETHLEPDSATVWAEERFLDSLAAVYTVSTLLSDLSQTTRHSVSLQSIKGVKIEPAVTTLVAQVDVYTEKTVRVPVIGTNFPGGYALRTFPPTADITFRVGARDYKNVTADQFVLSTTYEELMALSDSVLPLRLRSIPEGVSQVRIQPETVQFLIEQTEDE